jgi:hypothetical protein
LKIVQPPSPSVSSQPTSKTDKYIVVKEIESTSLSVILGSQEQLKVDPKKNKLLERYQSKFDKIFVSDQRN